MFGKEEYTNKCIELTVKNAGVPIDVLVVDDGSEKRFSYGYLNPNNHKVSVLRIDKNSGFTNAINQGLLWASRFGYDYVHMLNNDTEPRPNFIKVLFDEMQKDPNIGLASSVRLHPNGEDYTAELFGIDLIRGYQCVTKFSELKGQNEVIECNWVPTCSGLIRVDTVRELGLFDKRMRNHSSDLDYCLRIKMAGYRIVVMRESIVVHHHEVTTKEHKINPEHDQRVLLEKLAGIYYAQFMKVMPLDAQSKTYGQLEFRVVQR
jgi:GT2 family glycosyltransferase